MLPSETVVVLIKVLLATAALILLWQALTRPVHRSGHALPGDSLEDRLEAERRSNVLLKDILSNEEYHQLTIRGYLEVKSPRNPDRVYRIPRHQGVVKVYENGLFVMYLCVQPVKFLPSGDVVAMHKLSIEGDEDQYLRIANRWYCSPNPTLGGLILVPGVGLQRR